MKETNVFNKQKEREGFEPSIVPRTIPVFKTGAINHSAISPQPNLYFTSGYSGSCIRVYSIQRYIEKELVSDIFLEANKSFYFLYGYVLFVGVK